MCRTHLGQQMKSSDSDIVAFVASSRADDTVRYRYSELGRLVPPQGVEAGVAALPPERWMFGVVRVRRVAD